MTKAFERFLRSFSDEDLTAFARQQVEKRPPYRRAIEVAVRIELDRRDLRLAVGDEAASDSDPNVGDGSWDCPGSRSQAFRAR